MGDAGDASTPSKLHAALSYVFQRQFVWLVKSINWATLPWIPDEQPFKAQLKKSVNFHGYVGTSMR